jgi:hypothetical protein
MPPQRPDRARQRQALQISSGGKNPRIEGKAWEDAFQTVTQLQGFKILKIPEMGRWLGPGTFRPIKGWSDFMIVRGDGVTAFMDTKTTQEERFSYSDVNQDQIKFFSKVGDLVPAGYVVYFRQNNKIIYLPWTLLQSLRPGEAVSTEDGILMGHLTSFSVAKIFSLPLPQGPGTH